MEKLPNFHACFVCGDRNPSGLKIRFQTDGESVTARFRPEERHMGYHGHVHGGILASLLDETMGWAPILLHRRFCVTIELNVQYLKPAPIGTTLIVTARPDGGNRRIYEAEGQVTDDAGTVYAKGRGRYMAVSSDKTREVIEYLTFDEGCVPPDRLVEALPSGGE